MSYKTDTEKGFKLLRSVSPPIIFVNGPSMIGKTFFVNKFKKEGYSILTLVEDSDNNLDKILNFLKNQKRLGIDHMSCIIEANIKNEKLISDIFSNEYHNFTYVFLYPNNLKKYKEYIKDTNKEQLIDLSTEARERYKRHLEYFDDKILTILI